jgi:hypothetical protein
MSFVDYFLGNAIGMPLLRTYFKIFPCVIFLVFDCLSDLSLGLVEIRYQNGFCDSGKDYRYQKKKIGYHFGF